MRHCHARHRAGADLSPRPRASADIATGSTFFEKARAANGKCLAHCAAGINRSGFFVILELMVSDSTFVLDAVRQVKRIRGTVLLNPSFQVQLLEMAREMGTLGQLEAP